MNLKFYFIVLILLAKNSLILGGEGQCELKNSFNSNNYGSVKITGTVEIINKVIPFDSLSFDHKQQLRDLKHDLNKHAINVVYKDLKATSLLTNSEVADFDFNLIDVFKIGYLPIDSLYQFQRIAKRYEYDTRIVCECVKHDTISFNRTVVTNDQEVFCKIELSIHNPIAIENIINGDEIAYSNKYCLDCCTVYKATNLCDKICCCLTFEVLPSCPCKKSKCVIL